MKADRVAVVLVVLLVASGSVGAVTALADAAAGTDAASGTAQEDTVTITVHVQDTLGGNVSNAEVTASWDGGTASATTRNNGRALLDVPRGARVELSIQHPEYTRNDPYVIDDARGRTYEVRAYRSANVEVTVLEEGSPVEGATVILSKQDREGTTVRGTTGADGVFRTDEPIESGTYTATAVKEGYARNETVVTASRTTRMSIAIQQEVVTFEVEIVDDHFDPPRKVTEATIEYDGLTSGTIEVGGTATTNLPLQVNADYRIAVRKEGYETVRRRVSVGEEGRTLRFTINREPSLTVEPDNREVLVGNRVDLAVTDEYGDPVANASVLVDGTAVGETNADGEFRATIESAGNHTISARKDGVTSGEVTVEGVSRGGDATPTATATSTASPGDGSTPTPGTPEFDLSQPGLVVQIGVAAAGVVLAFLVVRRLL